MYVSSESSRSASIPLLEVFPKKRCKAFRLTLLPDSSAFRPTTDPPRPSRPLPHDYDSRLHPWDGQSSYTPQLSHHPTSHPPALHAPSSTHLGPGSSPHLSRMRSRTSPAPGPRPGLSGDGTPPTLYTGPFSAPLGQQSESTSLGPTTSFYRPTYAPTYGATPPTGAGPSESEGSSRLQTGAPPLGGFYDSRPTLSSPQHSVGGLGLYRTDNGDGSVGRSELHREGNPGPGPDDSRGA